MSKCSDNQNVNNTDDDLAYMRQFLEISNERILQLERAVAAMNATLEEAGRSPSTNQKPNKRAKKSDDNEKDKDIAGSKVVNLR